MNGPPSVSGDDFITAKERISSFTDDDLREAYGLPLGLSRDAMILLASKHDVNGPKWKFLADDCKNLHTVNSINVTHQVDFQRKVPANRIISYGYTDDYVCYRLSELLDSIIISTDEYAFYIPDAADLATDHTTGPTIGRLRTIISTKRFPKNSYRQLLELLNTIPEINRSDNDKLLIRKLLNLMAVTDNSSDYINLKKLAYEVLSTDEKVMVKGVFLLLFIAGMLFKGWKGPGSPFPKLSEHIDYNISTESKGIADEIINNLYKLLENPVNRIVKSFLEMSYVMRYDWTNISILAIGKIRVGIYSLLENFISRNTGIHYFSHAILDTGYIYTRFVTNIGDIDIFNIVLNRQLASLYPGAIDVKFSPSEYGGK